MRKATKDDSSETQNAKREIPRLKRAGHWFTNVFWYHYKWHAVIALFLTLVAGYSLVSIINQERPDFTYLFAVEGRLVEAEVLDEWNQSAGDRLADVNGDGKVVVFGSPLGFDGSEYGMANRMKFTAEISSDDLLLLVVDESTLAGFEDQSDFFLPLGELGLPSDPDRLWTLRVEPPAGIRMRGVEEAFYLCVKDLPPEKRARPEIRAQYEQAAVFAGMLIEFSAA